MDIGRRSLAALSTSIWYCTRSVLKLDEQLHRRTGYARHDHPYEIWHFHFLWRHDIPGVCLHLVLWSVSCLLSSPLDYEANRVIVPETKRLTLEEMDLVFGSSGVAVADRERMAQINREIGLDTRFYGEQQSDDDKDATALDEKAGPNMNERTGHLR
jgi:hypothetical protein